MSQFRDNTEAGRYEYDVADVRSIADYVLAGAVRVITHVETPAHARGRGYAAELMAKVVEHARARSLKLRATCPYAVTYFQRHPDSADVQA
jgi:predicted GNAT family acetyltransferase